MDPPRALCNGARVLLDAFDLVVAGLSLSQGSALLRQGGSPIILPVTTRTVLNTTSCIGNLGNLQKRWFWELRVLAVTRTVVFA